MPKAVRLSIRPSPDYRTIMFTWLFRFSSHDNTFKWYFQLKRHRWFIIDSFGENFNEQIPYSLLLNVMRLASNITFVLWRLNREPFIQICLWQGTTYSIYKSPLCLFWYDQYFSLAHQWHITHIFNTQRTPQWNLLTFKCKNCKLFTLARKNTTTKRI